MLRDTIKSTQTTSMKAGNKPRTAALRLILAKIKDRDIELRTSDTLPDDDAMVIEVLQKMVKQRKESIELYEKGGRQDRADDEKAEMAVISEFLPQTMDEAKTKAVIESIVAETGASSMKDMGKVMGQLKGRHASELDMSMASALVKAALS